jgi:3-dehydroquinate synthase
MPDNCWRKGGELLERTESHFQSELLSWSNMKKLVELSIGCKAGIVAADIHEAGPRMVLNLGHTFAHGMEQSLSYGKLLHGEAVIVGLLAAIELSGCVRETAESSLYRYRKLVEKAICQVPHCRIESGRVLEAMRIDKKRGATGQKFVLLDSVEKPFIAEQIDRRTVRAALERALAFYDEYGGSYSRSGNA